MKLWNVNNFTVTRHLQRMEYEHIHNIVSCVREAWKAFILKTNTFQTSLNSGMYMF